MSARRSSGADRLLVHFDVDVVDFTDTPLSENIGRNEGLPYALAIEALDVLLASPRLAGLTITELNPAHTEEGSNSIEQLSHDVARGLAARQGVRATPFPLEGRRPAAEY